MSHCCSCFLNYMISYKICLAKGEFGLCNSQTVRSIVYRIHYNFESEGYVEQTFLATQTNENC